jgi:hypothetical protein
LTADLVNMQALLMLLKLPLKLPLPLRDQTDNRL